MNRKKKIELIKERFDYGVLTIFIIAKILFMFRIFVIPIILIALGLIVDYFVEKKWRQV